MTPLGAVAQLGERLLCKQEVVGSSPIGSIWKPSFRGDVGAVWPLWWANRASTPTPVVQHNQDVDDVDVTTPISIATSAHLTDLIQHMQKVGQVDHIIFHNIADTPTDVRLTVAIEVFK